MAHYALLDENNLVVQVITGKDETDTEPDGTKVNWEVRYSELTGYNAKRTSYNTFANTHKLGGIPFRKNYAWIGGRYDEKRDAFIPPKPEVEGKVFILNEDTCLWEESKG